MIELKAIKSLRLNAIHAELYPDNTKMKKQMIYANRKQIPYVILAGDSEMKANKFTLKNMISGEFMVVLNLGMSCITLLSLMEVRVILNLTYYLSFCL